MDKLKKDLEAARREKSMALRCVNSLEVECQDLQAALGEADAGNYEVDEIDLTEAGTISRSGTEGMGDLLLNTSCNMFGV